MTLEGGDGFRYLVRRDGSLVKPGDGRRVVRLDELDPASARLIRALIAQTKPPEKERGKP